MTGGSGVSATVNTPLGPISIESIVNMMPEASIPELMGMNRELLRLYDEEIARDQADSGHTLSDILDPRD